jgi:PncC family amidohydrolase
MVRLRLTIHGEDPTAMETLNCRNASIPSKDSLRNGWSPTKTSPCRKPSAGMLRSRGQTLGTAESCTGGYIAHLITSIPGSSHYFKGSVVSYDNEVKKKMLHVAPRNPRTARSRQPGHRRRDGKGRTGTTWIPDFAIATSGIMGPDGGSPEKPVGTVWIAVGNHQNIQCPKSFSFRFDRQRNIELTATNALNLFRKFILSAGNHSVDRGLKNITFDPRPTGPPARIFHLKSNNRYAACRSGNAENG